MILAVVLNAVLLGVSSFGAEKASVDAVLDRYVKAIGGKEALQKVESRRVKADFEAMGSKSEWTLEAKAPNKQVTRVDLPGIGLIEEGYDGKTAWSKSAGGVRTKEGDELERAKKQADFYREIRLKELYPNLEVKGTEKWNGKEVQVLESKSSPTSKDRFSFSTETGLLVRQQSEFESEGNQVEVDVQLGDYRAVDGVKYPYEQKVNVMVGGQPVFAVARAEGSEA